MTAGVALACGFDHTGSRTAPENGTRSVPPSPGLSDLLPGLGSRTLVMGILNVTPDSFSDGGLFSGEDEAVSQA
jgi:hypothetical protein